MLLNFPSVSLLYELMAVTGKLENIRDHYYQANVPGFNPEEDMLVKLKLEVVFLFNYTLVIF